MYYKNPITRFVLRKNWHRRVRMRLAYYYEKLTKNEFDDLRFIFEGKRTETIFDIGANIGLVTYQFQKRFSAAHIYSFEPNPAVFDTLEASYRNETNVKPINMGIADVTGHLSFNVNSNTGTSSFLSPTVYHKTHQARKMLPPIDVEVTTIDQFTSNRGISHINILKMDIEGYELKALQGADNLLRNQAVDAIYTEVSIIPQYVEQPLFHELTRYLEEKKYYLYNIYGFVMQKTLIRQALIGNAIYISEHHRHFLEERYGTTNCGW